MRKSTLLSKLRRRRRTKSLEPIRQKRSRRHILPIEQLEDRRLLAVWSGTLNADTTWTNAEVQEISGDLTVASGVTLTVEPGTIVKLPSANAHLYVNGSLNAHGTTAEKIIFTSIRDDIGGDTNGDGNATTPGRGNWARIQVNGTAAISNAEIRYGGHYFGSMLEVNGGDLTLSDSTVRDSETDGVRVIGSDSVLTNIAFNSNSNAAISMDLNSNPSITGSTMVGNGINAMQVDPGTLTRDLTWDNPGIVYRPDGDITVPNGVTLTINAGQIVKPFGSNTHLFVDGALDIAGTAEDPVVFTSVSDDTHGGDTNGDGDASTPISGHWARILMRDESTNNRIDHAEFHYGGHYFGAMVQAVATDLTVSNSKFVNSETDGLRLDGSDAIITDNFFENNANAAISMDLNSNPDINGFTWSGNGINGMQVDAGPLQKDLTWNNPEVVYRPDGDITVPTGTTLAIDAGQIVKPFGANTHLFVNGTLDITGTVEDPVVFTSIHDDTHGGDTNGDADATSPLPGHWARIQMRDDSINNRIDYAEFHFGGHYFGHMVQAIATDLAVSNSKFVNSETDGLRLDGSDAIITENFFENNANAAISMDLNSNPDINGFTWSGNGINGMQVDAGPLQKDLTWNNPEVVYRPDGDITVPTGTTLAIDAGQIVKPFGANTHLFVNGTLDITGTVEDPVVFTSIHDDTHGGDTNGDADATSPSPGHWARIQMRDDSINNRIDYAEFHFGGHYFGHMVQAIATDLSVSNSKFVSSETDGLRLDDTDAVITNNFFENNANAAISMDLNSNPDINGFTWLGNGINGMQVDAGPLQKDLTWNNPEVVYRPDGDITVPAGLMLTVDAGQIVKPFGTNLQFYVRGILDITGTASDPVVFTSIYDDTHGGDTLGDGDASMPSPGQWARILLLDGSVDSHIEHAEFHYGGHYFGAMVQADASVVTIENSLFRNSETNAIVGSNNASVDATSCLVFDNVGSGVVAASGAFVTVVNNTIDRNSRGILSRGTTSNVNLVNSVVSFNTQGVVSESGGTVTMQFNDVFNPDGTNFVGVDDPTGTDGNISADPKYIDAINARYQLLSGSAVIDAANGDLAPATDYDGNLRFDDPGIANIGIGAEPWYDLGAFERQEGSDPKNLVIENVAVDKMQVGIGDPISISWTVRNDEVLPIDGGWIDVVFASSDEIWDIGDVPIAEIMRTDVLAPGESYNQQTNINAPPSRQGDLFFIVRTDARQQVRESVESDNQAFTSTELDVPELVLDTPLDSSFLGSGELQYYRIDVPGNRTLTISLDSEATSGSTSMFLRQQDIASSVTFDAASPSVFSPDQQLELAETDQTTYYLTVRADSGAAASSPFTLNATLPGFKLSAVSPAVGGNSGELTLDVVGTDLTRIARVTLVSEDNTVVTPMQTRFTDPTSLSVTFDLQGVAAGSYDVRVVSSVPVVEFDEEGNQTTGEVIDGDATLVDAFEVVDEEPTPLTTRLLLPSAARFGRVFPIHLEVINEGMNDVTSPLLLVHSPSGTPLSLTPDFNANTPSQVQVMPLSDRGLPTVMKPGDRVLIPVYASAITEPDSTFVVQDLTVPSTALAWDDVEAYYRDQTTDAQWAETWANFKSLVGDSWGELHDVMRMAATERVMLQPQTTFVAGAELIRDLMIRASFGEQDTSQFLTFPNGMLDPDPFGIGGADESAALGERLTALEEPILACSFAAAERGASGEDVDENEDGCAYFRPRNPVILASMEAWAQTSVIAALSGRNGTLASSLFVEFLNNDAPSYHTFSESHEVVDGTLAHAGFRNSSVTRRVLQTVFNDATHEIGRRLDPRLAAGSPITAEQLPPFESVSFPVESFFSQVGQLDSRLSPWSTKRGGDNESVYFADALHYGGSGDTFSIPNAIAGGVGKTDKSLPEELQRTYGSDVFGDDERRIFGNIILKRIVDENDKTIRIEAKSDLRVFIKDTIDFCPGDLGDGLTVKAATVPLANLEANGWAYDVGFQVEFASEVMNGSIRIPRDFDKDPDDPEPPPEPEPEPEPPTTCTGENVPGEHPECDPGDPPDDVPTVRPRDPNDIRGPAGVGEEGWIRQSELLPYTIRFENDPEQATAAAQEVIVSNPLSDNMDWETLELTGIGFGSQAVQVPAGRQEFSTIMQTTNVDGTPLDAMVDVVFDHETGTVTWSIRSVDPLTGLLPADPFAGFLPVNDESGSGEGFVTYTIRSKADVVTGDAIENQASIVFDINDPIVTNTALNTIDELAPTSSVSQLPEAFSTTAFMVEWSGTDGAIGSGVAAYDVYMSINDGSFQLALADTPATSHEFTGESGNTYSFVSTAVDQVGVRETKTLVAETTTLVIIGAWVNNDNIYDVDKSGDVTAFDALLVINELTDQLVHDSETSRLTPLQPTGYEDRFFDVEADGMLTALDALRVINVLLIPDLVAGEFAQDTIEPIPFSVDWLGDLVDDSDSDNDPFGSPWGEPGMTAIDQQFASQDSFEFDESETSQLRPMIQASKSTTGESVTDGLESSLRMFADDVAEQWRVDQWYR
ncbi:hypothetical protein CA13_08550 [Planctomycetes bacterium CA13]|uniref:Right handed beta helix domain-containing protein n=1 Tax=Novipirellula herctigrandis TaxID=2527986 RepID=A0A5C5YWM9_9BACT|nr:hypothetical protein CA13_08550 [Planctomycetes bacterium CA13]